MAGLYGVDHIVVLMMENRSFDHMLGYLKNTGLPGVDGVDGNRAIVFENKPYKQEHLSSPVFKPDPHHGHEEVKRQMAGGAMTGFVGSFAPRARAKGKDPGLIMGYHDERELPVYDYLARRFTVCDRWFSSMPGPTWPNRHFALCGHSEGHTDNGHFIQEAKTIFDHLSDANVPWRYYSHDIAFLRTVSKYTAHTSRIDKVQSFYTRAAQGTLDAVSFIDPNFTLQESIFGIGYANDDHPPVDVRRGQDLVSRIYNVLLLARNNRWKRTLFIVTYDEHGGFYDHVPPPAAVSPNGDPSFSTYGIRVPALVISPWAEAGAVSHTVFDHTSILKTILKRFCQKSDGALPDMGARVAAANDLEPLLSRPQPRDDAKPAPVANIDTVSVLPLSFHGVAGPLGVAGHEAAAAVALEPTDFQLEMLKLRDEALAQGVPEGKL
ncbi:phospholipase C [Hyalangium rubrum]|uniref:Alkaline phosphatase family protein n=1 Tax=Hyalangium rubrum TaxID=3103134 RepID=A0ABU5H0H4_9BACT|nr:alkaline phosphatase family protein [Hyalangium sp. s54d21]MDY7226953.1 alkaline phosphatase family protein [Hyalangium sp. s54d21]